MEAVPDHCASRYAPASDLEMSVSPELMTQVTSETVSARFDRHFLVPRDADNMTRALDAARDVLARHYLPLERPFSGVTPSELGAAIAAIDPCPEEGTELAELLEWAGTTVLAHSVAVSHPACVAHLHCPPLLPALAAETLASAMNQSMDSWDQAPAATLVEQRMVDWLCGRFGYAEHGAGTFTSGGTQSNLMGLMLARDHYCRRHLGWNVQQQGLPPEASRFRILCSEAAHFTVRQSAALLGLGHQAVWQLPVDAERRLSVSALEAALTRCEAEGLLPIAIAATAGTTDFGSIDPLRELAGIARRNALWLHVDAAYGGALMLSDRHRHRLDGLALADSVTVDFHKLFYQPIACGALLVRERGAFDVMRLHADYLNPEDNEADGYPDLVTKSLQTTRRFDALKLLVSLRTLGRREFAAMIDATIELAGQAAAAIEAEPTLALMAAPSLNAVVFRYVGEDAGAPAALDEVNRAIRLALLRDGEAVIAQTRVDGHTCLKLTLLNPRTTISDVNGLLAAVMRVGREVAA